MSRLLLLSLLISAAAAWVVPLAPARSSSLGRPRRRSTVIAAEGDVQLDALIKRLRASTPEELPRVISENLKVIDQRLFLRLAEMSDQEEDDYEKLRIRQLATLVATSVETILKEADKQMDAEATTVQKLLRTMATESGEFELPIPDAQLAALRGAIRECTPPLDEGFVGTVKAYMKKASDDGLEGMVDVLRVLLQVFAAERLRMLSGGRLGVAQSTVAAALDSTPAAWSSVLRAQLAAEGSECTADELVQALQDNMGEVVLGMPAGSSVQAVLAEYLNELMGCARAIAADDP